MRVSQLWILGVAFCRGGLWKKWKLRRWSNFAFL